MAGADTMRGGLGGDTYFVDNASDLVEEAAGAGTDRVISSITYTLGANVENLSLSGSAAINGTGNVLGNWPSGNDANNILTGGNGNDTLNGEAGNDGLNGGNGNDSFYFAGRFGNNTVTGFGDAAGNEDLLSIFGYGTDLDTWSELTPYITLSGTTTTINLTARGGGIITLPSFTGLDATDVQFFA